MEVPPTGGIETDRRVEVIAVICRTEVLQISYPGHHPVGSNGIIVHTPGWQKTGAGTDGRVGAGTCRTWLPRAVPIMGPTLTRTVDVRKPALIPRVRGPV